MIDEVIPEYRYKLKGFLAPHDLELKDYSVVLVHPWQYENVIVNKFADWILENDYYLRLLKLK